MKAWKSGNGVVVAEGEEEKGLEIHGVLENAAIAIVAENDLFDLCEEQRILRVFGEMRKIHSVVPGPHQHVVARDERGLAGFQLDGALGNHEESAADPPIGSKLAFGDELNGEARERRRVERF